MVTLELEYTTDRRPAKEFDFLVSTLRVHPSAENTVDKRKSGFFSAFQRTGSSTQYLLDHGLSNGNW
jgi:hypothetical protein